MSMYRLCAVYGVITGGIGNLAVFVLLVIAPSHCRSVLIPISVVSLIATAFCVALALNQTWRNVLGVVLALLLSAPLIIAHGWWILVVLFYMINGDS